MTGGTQRTHWLIGLGLLAVVGLGFALLGHSGYDDPYITFRYAANLRAGLGFVYNAGERVQSTTTPLYTLLLAGVGGLWGDLPRLSNLISALSLAGGGYCLYWLGIRSRTPLAGVVAAFLYATFPLLWTTLGAETSLYLLFLLASLVALAGRRERWAFALAGLATLARPDGALTAGVLAVVFLVRHRRFPWSGMGLYVGLIAPWFLFAWAYFGSPLPVTLAAKQHQGQMAISDSFLRGLTTTLGSYGRQWQYWIWAAVGLFGSVWLISWGRRWWPLFAWSALYLVAFAILGVSRYFWYYAPLVPVLVAAVGLGVEAIARLLGSRLRSTQWAVWVLGLAGVGLLLWPNLRALVRLQGLPDSRLGIYRDVGQWLAAHVPADASVGTLEAGIIGYYAGQRMIDFAGLIQPEVATRLTRDTTYEDAARWALARYEPDYVVLGRGWFPRLEADAALREGCTPLRIFTHPDYKGELIVYRCEWQGEGTGQTRQMAVDAHLRAENSKIGLNCTGIIRIEVGLSLHKSLFPGIIGITRGVEGLA